MFSERLCIRVWGKGGYYPFTRLYMVILARDQIAAKRDREGRANKVKKKRRTHAVVAKAIKNVSAVDAMAIVNAADPRYSMLPTLAEVTGKRKFPVALLDMNKLSPSDTKVIDCLEKKEAVRAPEEEAKDVGRQERPTEREKNWLEGNDLWRLERSWSSLKVLHKYNTKDIERVGIYLDIKWKDITNIKDRIKYIYQQYPAGALGNLPSRFNQPAPAPSLGPDMTISAPFRPGFA